MIGGSNEISVEIPMSTNGYPFLSRKQILGRLAEPAFAATCVAILQDRYERRAALPGEAAGWMASHAATATKIAAKIAAGEASEKERAEVTKLASRYTKQLARVFRDRELAARPELVAQAAVFGIALAVASTAAGESGAMVERVSNSVAPPSSVEPPAPTSAPASAPKRRGRPPGSKNRPRGSKTTPIDEPKLPRKRRARS